MNVIKKITLIISLYFLFSPLVLHGQQKTLRVGPVDISNATLKSILEQVQWEYGVRIEYKEQELPSGKITVKAPRQTLKEFLEKIIAVNNLDLTFTLDNPNAAVLYKKSALAESFKMPESSEFQPTRKNFTLTGKIVEKESGETLPFAAVFVTSRPDIYTQSNVDGYFSLQNVPSDTVILKVTYLGFVTYTARLTPSTPLTGHLVELQAEPNQLKALVVQTEKTEMVQANQVVGMVKMTPRNIAKLPNVGEKDPFRAFQLMPGVSASNESSSGLYVRGGTPDQTLVLYDGFTVYNVDHLFGFFSAFNYNAVKDIQLYKGGFDARFGGRISAVAEITGKEGNTKNFNAGMDLSLLSTNGYLETPVGKKMTFLLAGRRSYKGPLYNKIFNKFTESEESAGTPAGGFPGRGGFNNLQASQKATSYFYDVNAKLTFKPNKRDIFSLSFFNGTDNMDNSTASGFSGFGPFQGSSGGLGNRTTDVSEWGNTGSSFKWSHQYNSKLYSNSLVSFSNYYSERDNSRTINISRNDSSFTSRFGRYETNNLVDFSFKSDWEWKFLPRHQLETGTMISQNRIQFNYVQNDTTTILNRDDAGVLAAFYLQDRFRLMGDKLELIPGLRFNYFNLTDKVYTEPRFTFNYQYSPQIKIKGGAGVYYQFIKQINREDISEGNRNFWILANGTHLPVTRAEHLILGAAYEKKNYLLDVEFYRKRNYGITEYTLRFVPSFSGGGPGMPGSGGLSTEETFFNGDETIQGVDVLLQKKFGSVTGWLGYTLAQAARKVSAFSDLPYYSDQDVRHQFKAVATYTVHRWDLSGTWLYSSGRPYTSVIGAYDITLLDGTVKSFTNPTDKNANRFPAYHRLDISANYNFKNGTIGFSVFNLYNRSNIWYKRFEVIRENGVSVLQTTNVTYLGITPNLILSFKLK